MVQIARDFELALDKAARRSTKSNSATRARPLTRSETHATQKTLRAHTERAVINHDNVGADARAMDSDSKRRLEIVERYGDGQPYDRLRVVTRAALLHDAGRARDARRRESDSSRSRNSRSTATSFRSRTSSASRRARRRR
jgi:hypothetical protein